MQKPDSFDDTAPEPKKQRTIYYSNKPIHDAVTNREQPSARNAGSTSLLDENLVHVDICCGCSPLSKECRAKGSIRLVSIGRVAKTSLSKGKVNPTI